jgi:membrane protease YdiL (CAAX protease family)
MYELTGISERPAWLSTILILITTVLGFLVIGPLIGFLAAMPFYEGTLFDLQGKLTNPTQYPELRLPLIIMQGCATLIGLILIPLLYLKAIEKVNALNWVRNKSTPLRMVLITAFIVISFMATNSVFIEWNAHFVFPDFLKDFGEWARDKERQAEQLTRFFTTFSSTGDFFLGLFVIALLPGIGEELVFRGMIQPELNRWSGNHHVAIWVTAILFSAFHMQFFGFVPRMLLGALFGYLSVWSGNLLFPMIAHFVNNGFSVWMMYLYQNGTITIDMESPEAAPWWVVAPFTLLFAALLIYFKNHFQNPVRPSE